jgi:hypothetical protein
MSNKTIEELEAELLRCSNESQGSQLSSSKDLRANRLNFLVGSEALPRFGRKCKSSTDHQRRA